ncbi:hypothetical protein GIB67_005404 [Kingdonia uniflora]|uniref:Allene oxide synthase n=1 Tax=Kingdonia uniflora TaxID=39325 RepID=A0A7J7NHV2_9MAGN|nr:hypothetical protein GIB67_005404 [Kingdonia uniflora]
MTSPSSTHNIDPSPLLSKLPIQKIPGDYGIPFFGPIKDRYDYFYNQGEYEFFRSRIAEYKSTVFRANMPPGPFIASNPNAIVLLDAATFPVLFDMDKVEKKNLFDGTYMPSTSFTGGYRVCSFLDPSEPNHGKLKRLFLSILASAHDKIIPKFQNEINILFTNIEEEVTNKGKADFNAINDNMSFDFVFKLFFNKNPSETKIGTNGSKILTQWIFFQLAPLMSLGIPKLPNFIEDLLLHTFKFPFFPVKSGYKNIYDVVYEASTPILDKAEKLGIKRDEACHNLVFVAGFNTFGGLKTLFPLLIKWVSLGGETLHKTLAKEIRSIVHSEEGNQELTISMLEKMALTKSVVYEVLRIEPPVPYQYGKAKKDLIINGHDAAFEVKKGEMLFGFQPFATKDPKVFENPEEFIPERFLGDSGEKLLKYVLWSNERETEEPSEINKQCPGKNLVVLLCRLMLTGFFLRYDTFTVEIGKLPLGSSVKITSLTKATNN